MEYGVKQRFSLHWWLWSFLISLWHWHSLICRFLSFYISKTFQTLLTSQPTPRFQIPLQEIDHNENPTAILAQTALKIMKTEPRGLDILCLAHRNSPSLQIPSWLPDLSASRQENEALLARLSQYSASGPRTFPPHIKIHNNKLLELHAVQIGTVISLGRDHHTPRISRLKHWELLATGGLSPLKEAWYAPTGELLTDAFWRTIFWDSLSRPINTQANNNHDKRRRVIPADDVNIYKEWYEFIQTHNNNNSKLASPPLLPSHLQNIHTQIMQDMREFRFARVKGSSKGEVTFSMLPSGARVGDSIWLFLGASVPFVMRDEGAYEWVERYKKRKVMKIVGGCYVHGCMDGEEGLVEGLRRLDGVVGKEHGGEVRVVTVA